MGARDVVTLTEGHNDRAQRRAQDEGDIVPDGKDPRLEEGKGGHERRVGHEDDHSRARKVVTKGVATEMGFHGCQKGETRGKTPRGEDGQQRASFERVIDFTIPRLQWPLATVGSCRTPRPWGPRFQQPRRSLRLPRSLQFSLLTAAPCALCGPAAFDGPVFVACPLFPSCSPASVYEAKAASGGKSRLRRQGIIRV